MIDFEEDANKAPAQQFDDVAKLVKQLGEALSQKEELEEALKVRNDLIYKLKTDLIPAAMQEHGVKELKTDDGVEVKIAKDVYCSEGSGSRPEGLEWLEKNNFGALIKQNISIFFGKNEEFAKKLVNEFLSEKKIAFEDKKSVHPMTLKAFLNEELKKGKEVPLEKFGATQVTVAKVKIPEVKPFKLSE